MEPTVVMSIAGLALTAASTVHAFKVQDLEGAKACDNQTIKVLYKDDRLFLKTHNQVFVMTSVPTNKGVTNVKRFETKDRRLAFLQLPEKAMLLNNATMRPVSNDCINI